ncbi:MAG TPA: sugar transferase [Mollicutes bacterium]|nr:sugar transferase [Mollicutes bacterium]
MYRKFFKRLFDIVFSFILIILLFPVMIITGIIVYIDLGKPIFFNEREPREGKNRKPFIMYKFRTKRLNSEGCPDYIKYSDISKILDITRINELPQLFNILKGDMSFVGPRPFVVGESLPPGKIHEERYLVKPGLTGAAQAAGAQTVNYLDKLEFDVIYYNNISFMYDLKLIFKTPIWLIKYLFKYLKEIKPLRKEYKKEDYNYLNTYINENKKP